jgi:hypothetical protein
LPKKKRTFVPQEQGIHYINSYYYNQYLSGNSWKCEKSPTGAHNFSGDNNKITCKYCGITRNTENNSSKGFN